MVYTFRSYSGAPYLYDGWTNKLFSVHEDLFNALAGQTDNKKRRDILERFGINPTVSAVIPSLKSVLSKIDDASGPCKITIEATQACNLRCSYCSHTLSGSLTEERPHRNRHLDHEVVDLLIYEYFSSDCDNIREIFFYGGEPLVNADVILYAVRKIRDAGSHAMIQVVSNGILLHDLLLIQFFIAYDVGLQISLDGPLQDNYRFTIDGRGSLDTLLKNLAIIKAQYPEYYQRFITFNATIPWDSDYNNTMNFFDTNPLTCDNWQGQNFEIHNINRSTDENNPLNQRRSRCKEYVLSRKWEHGFKMADLVMIQPVLFMAFRKLGETPHSFFHEGCTFYLDSVYVDVDGRCFLCEKTTKNGYLGSLGKDSEIKNGAKKYYQKLHNLVQEHCNNCWANKLCQICVGCIGRGEVNEENFRIACQQMQEVVRQNLELYSSLKEAKFDFFNALQYNMKASQFAEKHYSHVMNLKT